MERDDIVETHLNNVDEEKPETDDSNGTSNSEAVTDISEEGGNGHGKSTDAVTDIEEDEETAIPQTVDEIPQKVVERMNQSVVTSTDENLPDDNIEQD
jgi:hypothetical protein